MYESWIWWNCEKVICGNKAHVWTKLHNCLAGQFVVGLYGSEWSRVLLGHWLRELFSAEYVNAEETHFHTSRITVKGIYLPTIPLVWFTMEPYCPFCQFLGEFLSECWVCCDAKVVADTPST